MAEANTVVRDSTGMVIFKSTASYTSPAWYKNIIFVRGLCEDDAIYKINLNNGVVNKFYSCSLGTGGGHGGGDDYYSLPAPTVDTLHKTLTASFDRSTERYYEKSYKLETTGITYDVVLTFSGKVIRIDSTEN